jgi:hypothetical protein
LRGTTSFRDRNVGTPSVDGHPPFSVGAAPENVDALALIGSDYTGFLVDVLRFVYVPLKRPIANDREANRSLLPFRPIGAEISSNPLSDGVFSDDLGFIRCLIDDVVRQIGEERLGIVAIDGSYVRTMRGRFDGLRVGLGALADKVLTLTASAVITAILRITFRLHRFRIRLPGGAGHGRSQHLHPANAPLLWMDCRQFGNNPDFRILCLWPVIRARSLNTATLRDSSDPITCLKCILTRQISTFAANGVSGAFARYRPQSKPL